MKRLSGRAASLWSNKRFRWVALVVSLALLMLALGALSRLPSSSDDEWGTTALLASDYDSALLKLQSGETTEAVALLQDHLAANPNDAEAADLLKRLTRAVSGANRITESSDVSPDSASGETPPDPVPQTDWSAEIADITRLLPLVVQGLVPGSIVHDKSNAVIPFDPVEDGDYGQMRRILYSVHDRGDSATAGRYVAETSKAVYSKNGENITVDGASAYFGTDGKTLATVAYARGRYVFEVVITVSSAPEELRYPAADLAGAFPDSMD